MEMDRPRTTTRDPAELAVGLSRWLSARFSDASVTDVVVPASNGMSSETVLFDAAWTEGGERRTERCVARIAPDMSAVPVFPVYDLERQFRAMRLVGERSAIPVPETLWWEPDPAPLGAPFMVMARVDGDVPPDVMPYTMQSWLLDADPADQRRLQDATVEAIAGLHAIDVTDSGAAFLALDRAGDSPLRRHVADTRAYYDWVSSDGVRLPLADRALEWLESRWPAVESGPVLSWGDSRIGNVIYRDFTPASVLDWEMVALAPREVDLGWLIWMHRFFQDLAELATLPGMPHFLRREDVAATYEAAGGVAPRDLDWYIVYAALRFAIVMSRTARRQIHFGEMAMPDNPDELVLNHAYVSRLLDGTYW